MIRIQVELEFDELLKAVDQLSDEKKQALREHLAASGISIAETGKRKAPPVLGLHPGAFQPSDDFDDPLPDEFWLGEDA